MKRGQRRTRQLGSIERSILEDLSAGDMLYGFLLSGRSAFRAQKLAQERANYRYRRKLAIARLSRAGYVQYSQGAFSLGAKGNKELGILVENSRRSIQKKKWDYKWRLVVYDIPDTFASFRTRVRAILKRAGFAKLQQSVWVFPHECEELIQLLKEESDLAHFILHGVLERIEGGDKLRKKFRI